MIRFNDWHPLPQAEAPDPDRAFGPCAVTFSTYQLAFQATLEALGTTMAPIPVVMPVTSSPQVMAGVIRSGAQPVLLDIRPDTLQMDPDMVKACLENLEGCIFVLNRPMGKPVEPALLDLLQSSVSIVDTRLVPYPDLDAAEVQGTFSVFDLGPLVTEGAVVLHRHQDLLGVLRGVRSGVLGHSGALTSEATRHLLPKLPQVEAGYRRRRAVLSEYISILSEYNLHDRILWNHSNFPLYMLLQCDNVRRVIAHLSSYEVEVMHGVYGLHHFPAIRDRYEAVPEYAGCDSVQNKLVALPLNATMTTDDIVKVVRAFKEIA